MEVWRLESSSAWWGWWGVIFGLLSFVLVGGCVAGTGFDVGVVG